MAGYDNQTIAGVLDTMGDLLEIAGADRFRFLSYHKAANQIRAWPEDLGVMAEEGRLQEIPGVGAKLAASIGDILKTGTFPELEDMKAAFEPTLLEVMEVPGVGPKRARLLHDELGVAGLDDLEKALSDGSALKLPGFGSKTAERILAGIGPARLRGERTLLSEALPLAEAVASALAGLPGVESAVPGGSVRRWKPTVGDIDVLVAATDASAVMGAVRELPQTARVIGSGETKTSVVTRGGLQLDVRVVQPAEWGAALQYFTGNVDHNVRLREIAKKKGLKLSEYGVFRVSDGERLGGASEEEVYGLLGMDVPPPEIRHGGDEIEAASFHTLPELLELSDVRGDLHVHTDSTDSRSSLADVRAMAARLGYEYVAITDHAYNLRMVLGLDEGAIREQWARIDELNSDGAAPHILKGIELNIADDGSLDYPEEILAGFDICLASVHGGLAQPKEQVTERVLRAMDNPFVDVIAHPTARILRRRDPMDLDLEAVFEKAGATGTLMELNSYPDRLDLDDTLIRMARRHGVRFCLGTDAHSDAHMSYMRFGVAVARRGWMTPAETLNAQPLAEVRRWLRRSRVTASE